jgi:hypothetical protein
MIAPLVSLTMLALLVAVVAVVAAVVYAIRKGLQLWRDLKAGLRGLGAAMEEFGRKVDGLAGHEPPELERLAEAVERLRLSWAELSVLLNALRRVRGQWAGLLAVYPRK